MQFIGTYEVDHRICDNLIALHKEATERGLVIRGGFGTSAGIIVDTEKKDSYDLGLVKVPDDLLHKYKVPDYYMALKSCVDQYFAEHKILRHLGRFELGESPIIQYYKPGGGYKLEHFERTGLATASRMLVWMTYLNDVRDGGGTRFTYQNKTISARKGRTVVWPTDFTHTHAGVVSETEEKYIITGWLNFSE